MENRFYKILDEVEDMVDIDETLDELEPLDNYEENYGENMTDNNALKSLKRSFVCVLILSVLLFAFCLSAVTTYPNEYSVIRQFGKIVRIEENPGLTFKVPIISKADKLPNTLKVYDLPTSDVITKDKKSMIVDCYVLWNITDPKKFVQTLNGSISTAESRIDTIVYNSIKNTISDMTQDEVIQSRDMDISVADNTSELDNSLLQNTAEEVDEVEIRNLSEEIMDNFANVENQYGLIINAVEVKILDLPDENKSAVYERMIAERNNIAAQYQAAGEAEAQIIKNKADKEVSLKISKAKSEAEKLVAEGDAEYMRILSDAYNNPEKADFYLFVRALDSLKVSMKGNNKTIIIDKDSPIAKAFNTTE